MEPVVKFAIVREDPEVDLAILEYASAKRVLFVASGGCTLLEIAHRSAIAFTRNDIRVSQNDVLEELSDVGADQLDREVLVGRLARP